MMNADAEEMESYKDEGYGIDYSKSPTQKNGKESHYNASDVKTLVDLEPIPEAIDESKVLDTQALDSSDSSELSELTFQASETLSSLKASNKNPPDFGAEN